VHNDGNRRSKALVVQSIDAALQLRAQDFLGPRRQLRGHPCGKPHHQRTLTREWERNDFGALPVARFVGKENHLGADAGCLPRPDCAWCSIANMLMPCRILVKAPLLISRAAPVGAEAFLRPLERAIRTVQSAVQPEPRRRRTSPRDGMDNFRLIGKPRAVRNSASCARVRYSRSRDVDGDIVWLPFGKLAKLVEWEMQGQLFGRNKLAEQGNSRGCSERREVS
jgi:hypothetical protein